jgi:heme-degrading monooxygenase HmoA
MFVIIWEFEPHPGRVADFEEAYGPTGEWARLFGNSPQYLGTELLRDATRGSRYLTVDRWASREGFENFCSEHQKAYDTLDRVCDALTRREVLIGRFHFP